jgi:hypothetical protein
VTELLAKLEGLERGPAGNTSLTAAIAIAREMDKNKVIVVQETEYTAAGKLPTSQLTFARQNGIEVRRGNPRENRPGQSIVIPEQVAQIQVETIEMANLRESYIRNTLQFKGDYQLEEVDWNFLAEDSKSDLDFVKRVVGLPSQEDINLKIL